MAISPISTSPSAAAFAVARTWSAAFSFPRKPEAPASTASTSIRSSSWAVMITTLVAGETSLIRRVASMPLMPVLNSMSISTMSGWRSRHSSTAR